MSFIYLNLYLKTKCEKSLNMLIENEYKILKKEDFNYCLLDFKNRLKFIFEIILRNQRFLLTNESLLFIEHFIFSVYNSIIKENTISGYKNRFHGSNEFNGSNESNQYTESNGLIRKNEIFKFLYYELKNSYFCGNFKIINLISKYSINLLNESNNLIMFNYLLKGNFEQCEYNFEKLIINLKNEFNSFGSIILNDIKILNSILIYQTLLITFNADKNKFYKHFIELIKIVGNNNLYLKTVLSIFSNLFLNLNQKSIKIFESIIKLNLNEKTEIPILISNLFLSKIYLKQKNLNKSKFHFSIVKDLILKTDHESLLNPFILFLEKLIGQIKYQSTIDLNVELIFLLFNNDSFLIHEMDNDDKKRFILKYFGEDSILLKNITMDVHFLISIIYIVNHYDSLNNTKNIK
eukprot:gene9873-2195_t